jgi:hypothetical protein
MTDLKSNRGRDKNAPLLLRSDSKAVIHAPVDKIDIPEWLFTLTDEEYQQCSIAHIAGATSRSPDSERMSINVEMAGPALMVQHWTEEIADKRIADWSRCPTCSISQCAPKFSSPGT